MGRSNSQTGFSDLFSKAVVRLLLTSPFHWQCDAKFKKSYTKNLDCFVFSQNALDRCRVSYPLMVPSLRSQSQFLWSTTIDAQLIVTVLVEFERSHCGTAVGKLM